MKIWILFFLLLGSGILVSAQDTTKLRPRYINLNYVSEKLDFPEGGSLDSKYGAAFTLGRSYYLHKKPVLGRIRIGIDATWLDLNYAQYKESYPGDYTYEDPEEMIFHKGEIGMQVGPSVTVNPVSRLNAHLYFRYAPTFALLYDEDTFGGNYASFFVTGLNVSYGVIGLGIEKRWGECKYKEFGGGDEEEGVDYPKLKTSGMRVYLSFRLKRK